MSSLSSLKHLQGVYHRLPLKYICDLQEANVSVLLSSWYIVRFRLQHLYSQALQKHPVFLRFCITLTADINSVFFCKGAEYDLGSFCFVYRTKIPTCYWNMPWRVYRDYWRGFCFKILFLQHSRIFWRYVETECTSERWFFSPWHRQPSLVAFAPTSLLWLSGKASGLVTRRSWVRLQLGAFGFFRLFYWQKNHLSHVFSWFKIHRHISITVHKQISTFSPSSAWKNGDKREGAGLGGQRSRFTETN